MLKIHPPLGVSVFVVSITDMYSYFRTKFHFVRKILLIVITFLICNIAEAQWTLLNTGVQVQLKSVYFANSNTGWACGLNTIIKTTNAGLSWQSTTLQGFHRSIVFKDDVNGYVCGDNGKVYKTTDAGNSWNSLNTGVSVTLNQVRIAEDGSVVIPGNNSTILRSTDGGNSWSNILNIPAYVDFFAVKLLNSNSFIISGNESIILRTSNSGATWESISIGMPNPLFAVDFSGQSTGWVTGCCGMFMKTTNAGISWTTDDYLTPGYTLFSMQFIGQMKGWLAGEAGYILRTTNAGLSWDSLNSNTQLDLYSLQFVDENTGYISGYNGTVLKTTNGGGAGTPIGIINETMRAEDFHLKQNYPNPFNPSTKISYVLNSPGFITLNVHDINGRLISNLVNGRQNSGSYELEYTAGSLPSGAYFYSLNVNGRQISTRMMLILK